VSLDTIRHILTALGLPCETADDLAQSRQQLDTRAPPPVLTATTHQPVHVPCGSDAPSRLRITYEDGAGYHAAIGEIIIKYNGTLERYAGDGVMVVFNDPVPVENPALQAVLMALEVRDAIVIRE
jgi:hypothetical protein